MKTHSPVEEEFVDSCENLVGAFHVYELAFLQAEVYGRSRPADREVSWAHGIR
jgi:hypothetical protein